MIPAWIVNASPEAGKCMDLGVKSILNLYGEAFKNEKSPCLGKGFVCIYAYFE
jgi:hypothetical protein